MKSSDKVSKNIMWSVVERLCSQGMYFVVSVVLARVILPELYGAVTIVTVFVNLCAVVVQSGFSSALIYSDGDDVLHYSTAFWGTLMVTSLLYIGMFLAAPAIASFYHNEPVLTVYIRVMSFQFVFQGIQSIPFAYVSKHMLFRHNYIATFIGVLGSGIISILLAVNGLGVWALIGMTSIEVVIATVILWLKVGFRIEPVFDVKIFKSLLQYCWKLVAVDLLNSLYSGINSMIIGKKFSKSDVAYYNKAYNLPQSMFGSVNTAISKVLFPVFAEKDLKEKDRLRMVRSANRRINYILFPMLLGLASVAPAFVIVLFTEIWSPMTLYLQIMCVVWLFQPVQTCAIQLFKAIGKSDAYLKLEIAKKICAVCILVFFLFSFDSAIGIAWALLAGQLVSVLLNVPFLKKYLGYSVRAQIQDFLSPLAISAVMVAMVSVTGTLVENMLLKLVLQVFVGGVSYIIVSIVTKNEEFFYVLQMVKSTVLKRK